MIDETLVFPCYSNVLLMYCKVGKTRNNGEQYVISICKEHSHKQIIILILDELDFSSGILSKINNISLAQHPIVTPNRPKCIP